MRESDGLAYVVAEGLAPTLGGESRQLLLFARYCAAWNRLALFMRSSDEDAFRWARPDLSLGRKVEIWLVRG